MTTTPEQHETLVAHAGEILRANRYLTLGTADRAGRPWTTPVYFASAGLRDFVWMSLTDAEHSRHLAERPQVSLVVFDSTVPPTTGERSMRWERHPSCGCCARGHPGSPARCMASPATTGLGSIPWRPPRHEWREMAVFAWELGRLVVRCVKRLAVGRSAGSVEHRP